jgi:hypothetical protein
MRSSIVFCIGLAVVACGEAQPGLAINEIVSVNDGLWVDESGEDDDYVEIVNTADVPVSTAHYVLGDASGVRAALPLRVLQPGELLLLVADATPQQGPLHLPFKISGRGEVLVLGDARGWAIERVAVPPLNVNEALARLPHGTGRLSRCGRPSPGRPNGQTCGQEDEVD